MVHSDLLLLRALQINFMYVMYVLTLTLTANPIWIYERVLNINQPTTSYCMIRPDFHILEPSPAHPPLH